MTLPVHLTDEIGTASIGSIVTLTGTEAHHASVRRLRVGEQVLLTDGRGTLAIAKADSVEKREVHLTVESVQTVAEPRPRLTVAQAIPKGERADLAVQMLTEVGVGTIVPWQASRCVSVWRGERGDKSLAKWRATAVEAAKQSRRAWHPEVTESRTTESLAVGVRRALEDGCVVWVLHEEAPGRLGEALARVVSTADVWLIVGPEGGIAPEEIETLTAAGAAPVRLGDEVLRTSTAGVAASAAVLSRTSRWG